MGFAVRRVLLPIAVGPWRRLTWLRVPVRHVCLVEATVTMGVGRDGRTHIFHTLDTHQRYLRLDCLSRSILTRGEKTCWSRNVCETPRVPSVNGRDRHSCTRIRAKRAPILHV